MTARTPAAKLSPAAARSAEPETKPANPVLEIKKAPSPLVSVTSTVTAAAAQDLLALVVRLLDEGQFPSNPPKEPQ